MKMSFAVIAAMITLPLVSVAESPELQRVEQIHMASQVPVFD